MDSRTAEEARADYIEKMGEVLGAQFAALWQEVAHLHAKWSEYVTLFGLKPTRVDLLNQAAPDFFGMIQSVLWEETLLHIARLTDPPESLGRKDKANLTIQNLPELVDDPAAKAAAMSLVKTAVGSAEFCRIWRNRHIAHRDLDLALNRSAAQLPDASRKLVNEAISAITDVLNVVEAHYTDTKTHFGFGDDAVGALSLLYVLDDGLRAQAKRQERLLQGKIEQEDYPRAL